MEPAATDGFSRDALQGLDFYRRWPVFDTATLRQRLAEGLAPERATLLTKANLLTWARLDADGFAAWCDLFLTLDWRQRAALAASALREAGVAPPVVSAMKRIDRTRFVPAPYGALAFLNMSVPLGHGSNATMFGLGALVAEAVCQLRPRHICEVGFGSGLMAATLVHACDTLVSYAGFDPNQAALQPLWTRASSGDARLAAVRPAWEAFALPRAPLDGASLPPQLLLFSCAVTLAAYQSLRTLAARCPGLQCIVPRPLVAREFNDLQRHQPLCWRGQPVQNHAHYLTVPRAYMVLELLEHVAGEARAHLLCANIQYIAYREDAGTHAPEPFDLGALARLLLR